MTAKRLSFSFDEQTNELIDYLAAVQGITVSEAIRKAIATEAHLLKERKGGAKVLVQRSNKETMEILFR